MLTENLTGDTTPVGDESVDDQIGAIIDQHWAALEGAEADDDETDEGEDTTSEDEVEDGSTAETPDESVTHPDEGADQDEDEEEEGDDSETEPEDETDAEADGEADVEEGSDEEPEGDNSEELSRPVTVKVNGVEKEVPLEEVVQGYQLAESASMKFREASALRKEAEQALSFQDAWAENWAPEGVSPTELPAVRARTLGSLLEQVGSPQEVYQVWENLTARVAAIGAMPPQIAERLGWDAAQVTNLRAEHFQEQRRLEQETKAQEVQEASQAEASQQDLVNKLVTVVDTAGLTDAPAPEKEKFLREVLEFGTAKGIEDPVIAYYEYKLENTVKATAREARKERAKKVATSTPEKRLASNLASPKSGPAVEPPREDLTVDEIIAREVEAKWVF